MRTITLEELLEAGCHFGHQVTRHNPKARDFIFEARDNIHIIDLAKTKEGLEKAAEFIKTTAQKPDATIVVVATKRQAQGIVQEEIKRVKESLGDGSSIFSVTNRWIGGTLTNFGEVAKNYKKLKELGEKLDDPQERAKYTKKEVGGWAREQQKLHVFYGGIAQMHKKPDVLFIVDAHLEALAIHEAHSTGVATVAIVDTNADPRSVDYPIPANDDAVGSIKLITGFIMDAWLEGKEQGKKAQEKAKADETKKIEKAAIAAEQKEKKAAQKEKPAKKEAEKKTTKKTEVAQAA
ncbi:MAG TPA: 30S ribosomal protein S2 [Candidatus Saccharimonadales bacterium]|nr:30S ribosomal protein S2 [Candidatus Saccharimonadales bacterium]